MARLGGIGFVGFVSLALWVYCIFDVIATEDSLIRNLRKPLWLMIVIFLPTIGALAWLILGRPMYAGFMPGDTRSRAPRRILGPDDDPDWSPGRGSAYPPAPAPPTDPRDSPAARERRLQEREAELERRERELEERQRGTDEGPAEPD